MSEIKFISNNEEIKWEPESGTTTIEFLNKKLHNDPEAWETVKKESAEILSLCGKPLQKDKEGNLKTNTGLVFGYIQSGKTLSFTSVSCLAKDNGYRLIIVLGGTSTDLRTQTYSRLEKDLDVSAGQNDWSLYLIEDLKQNTQRLASQIESDLTTRENVPEEYKKTVIITILKHWQNIEFLNSVLKKIDLEKTGTLIIDDEADTVSLNTLAESNEKNDEEEQSSTYEQLILLKNNIPSHTYLGYTATPQANIFIDIEDELSPNFIYVLTPGESYTGGRVFFDEKNSYLSVFLNDTDMTSSRGVAPNQAPESLKRAMKLYFIGVTDGLIKRSNGEEVDDNRTMMINPDWRTNPQETYERWVTQLKNRFKEKINEQNPAMIKEFYESYEELSKHANLSPFNKILERIEFDIDHTHITVLNSADANRGNSVDWRRYQNIVIGGNTLARGYTVEGLTITYMPRFSNENTNSDTFQQRARFFGYRRNSLPVSRLFLDRTTYDNFQKYSESEEEWRNTFKSIINEGGKLDDLKRKFAFDAKLNWVRRNVLRARIIKRRYGGNWIRSDYGYTLDEKQNEANWVIFNKLKNALQLKIAKHSGNTSIATHDFCQINSKEFSNFFDEFKFSEYDIKLEHLKSVLNSKITNSDFVDIYIMSQGQSRVRTINDKGKLDLSQGEQFDSERNKVYLGDDYIIDKSRYSIQFHNLTVKDAGGSIAYENLLCCQIYVPASKAGGVVEQE